MLLDADQPAVLRAADAGETQAGARRAPPAPVCPS